MSRVFILPRRIDIPSGYLQIKDLYPQKSNYSSASTKRLISNKLYITQPPAYIDPIIEQDGEGNYYLVEEYKGLAAALLVTKSNSEGIFLNPNQLANLHNGILELMYNGAALDSVNFTILYQAVVDNMLNWTTGSFGAFNGLFGTTEVLLFLAGLPFTVPAGTIIAPANGVLMGMDIEPFFGENFFGETGEPAWSNRTYYVEDSLRLSYLKGDLHKMLSSHFIAYDPNYEPLLCNDERYIEGAAIQIYTENGDIYTYP